MRQCVKVYFQSNGDTKWAERSTAGLKSRMALYAIKGQKTIAELASEYGVHANQISIWKKQLLDAAPAAFSNGKDKNAEKKEVERDHLYQKVGQLQIEVDWLKKRPAIWDECFRESQMHRR